jgi:ADP-ribose pyrophosphatase YjhB (NUDIX family)
MSPLFRGAAHRVFRALPRGIRFRLVRTLTPNYTVGAVTLVHDADGALLLLRQPPGRGWSLPGGLLNRREDPARGAARELREETGLDVAPSALTPASPNARINPFAQQVDVIFTTTIEGSAAELTIDPVEVLEAGWFQADQFPPLTVATARLLALYAIGPYAGYATDGAPLPTDAPATQDSAADRPTNGPTR